MIQLIGTVLVVLFPARWYVTWWWNSKIHATFPASVRRGTLMLSTIQSPRSKTNCLRTGISFLFCQCWVYVVRVCFILTTWEGMESWSWFCRVYAAQVCAWARCQWHSWTCTSASQAMHNVCRWDFGNSQCRAWEVAGRSSSQMLGPCHYCFYVCIFWMAVCYYVVF